MSRETGLRRFKTVYLEMPRKNGKSSMSSGVGIYCCCADGEEGGEIYSAATTRDQAKIVWQDAWHMVERSPGLKAAFGVSTTAHAISQVRTASRFQALSAEGNSLDGLNIHCAIVDELHAHRTRKVFDVLETATGARSQPLLWLITTAGSDRSGICYEQRTYLTKILDGVVKDDTYFGVIYTIDDGDDWSYPKVWAKANPNYGVSVFPEDIERLCVKALKMPSAQNNFLTKRLSVWVNADSAFFNMVELAKCADPKLKAEDFLGEPCWIGIDLASRRDIAPRIQLFRRGDHFYCFGRYYLPESEIEESKNSQYSGWVREGWITATPGNIIDFGYIEEDLRELASKYQVVEVAYDPFQANQFATRMLAEGLPDGRDAGAGENLLRAHEAPRRADLGRQVPLQRGSRADLDVLERRGALRQQGQRLSRGRNADENKIDGVVALLMCLGRAMVADSEPGSIYEKRGPVFV